MPIPDNICNRSDFIKADSINNKLNEIANRHKGTYFLADMNALKIFFSAEMTDDVSDISQMPTGDLGIVYITDTSGKKNSLTKKSNISDLIIAVAGIECNEDCQIAQKTYTLFGRVQKTLPIDNYLDYFFKTHHIKNFNSVNARYEVLEMEDTDNGCSGWWRLCSNR